MSIDGAYLQLGFFPVVQLGKKEKIVFLFFVMKSAAGEFYQRRGWFRVELSPPATLTFPQETLNLTILVSFLIV